MDAESTEPSWLSKENDELHKQKVDEEAEPLLFGSGKITLIDEADDKPPDGDVESQGHSNYGSIKESDDKASSANSSKQKSKKASKKKQEKKPAVPQSVFDEDSHSEAEADPSSVSEDSETASLLESKPHMPNRNWCLEFFRFVSGVTVISSLGIMATQMIPLLLGGIKSQGYFDLALKVYVTLFCIIFILVEFNAPIPFVRNSQLLQGYLSRGFVYSFLGLICLEEAYSERVKEIVATHSDEFHVAWASLFMQISSWVVFGCGVFYMLMGVCCLKSLKDKLRKRDVKLWKKYREEMKEWKRMNK